MVISSSNENSYTIKDMAPTERPRERLANQGAQFLSNSELLALIIGTGVSAKTNSKTAIDLAQQLLASYDLPELLNVSIAEMTEIRGIGLAKAVRVKAALELSRRITTYTGKQSPIISDPESAAQHLMPILRYMKQEHFVILLLDTKNKLIKCCDVHCGTVNSSIVHPREVFREVIRHSAVSCILAHNHPSGDLSPSAEDMRITKRLCETGEIVGINVVDHIIIGNNSFLSFKREGLL